MRFGVRPEGPNRTWSGFGVRKNRLPNRTAPDRGNPNQFYNADILDIPNSPQESAEAYVDDAILIATGKTFTEAHEKLADMMQRENGMINWSKSHNSSIEYSKLALIDFSHHGVKKQRPSLKLPGVTIEPTHSTKYLGIILDQHLNWGLQLAQVRGKGSTWTAQIKRLTRPTWGLTLGGARKLYVSVALPRIFYGLDVWCTPLHRRNARGSRKGSVNTIKKLATVQRAGAIAVTGGLRTTPTDSLDVHAALLPHGAQGGEALSRSNFTNSHPTSNTPLAPPR
jgi:hypothetical protein